MKILKLANITNGLAYPHDDICYFQSQYGHSRAYGYFCLDSMPYRAVRHLLLGGKIEIIDATAKNKKLTDAQKYGIVTWCIVFNRALNHKGSKFIKVCDWETKHMLSAALSERHKPTVRGIRKLIKIYGYQAPAIIGKNVLLTCYSGISWDDKPMRLKKLLGRI